MARKPKIGLALGSGGARGWCHLGVLSVLDEIGCHADIIAGCSMGALVGAAEAGDARAELEAWAMGLTRGTFLKLMDFTLSRGGLVAGKGIADVLGEWGLDCDIGDLPRRFVAVATDLQSGREVWLQDGPLLPAVRASVSLPGLFSPQLIEGKWLLDGGLTNPVPISVARALGADVIVAVNPNAKPTGRVWVPERGGDLWDGIVEGLGSILPDALLGSEPDGPPAPQGTEVVNASIDMLMDYLRRTRLAADPPDVMIDVDLSGLSVMSFFQAEEAIAAGRAAAEAAADDIRKALEAVL
ncbi:patatin-like phospholipase family protein [Roseibacterium sp. SDUM158016]|uniref:patatin-like phospholipase family protein n=1 Tax=Roseicyclus sediminis TaxID=2980997 RepID=UPI0021CE56C1|nr:patatin-like phospholipase family protein [Roseibacterium sp. SDUM158016]MCU4651764.1 patatin-like phospholipase family protein [Roseibacterium sp. SDUM158016]